MGLSPGLDGVCLPQQNSVRRTVKLSVPSWSSTPGRHAFFEVVPARAPLPLCLWVSGGRSPVTISTQRNSSGGRQWALERWPPPCVRTRKSSVGHREVSQHAGTAVPRFFDLSSLFGDRHTLAHQRGQRGELGHKVPCLLIQERKPTMQPGTGQVPRGSSPSSPLVPAAGLQRDLLWVARGCRCVLVWFARMWCGPLRGSNGSPGRLCAPHAQGPGHH